MHCTINIITWKGDNKLQRENSKMWKEIHQQPQIIKLALEKNNEMLNKITNAVKERGIKNVVLVGRGSSEHALQVSKYMFEIYCGFTATICAPSVVTLYNGKMDLSNVLTIGVSQCGEARDVYEVMKRTQEQGGICVSITNERECLMSSLNEYYMNCECGKEESVTAAKSYLSQMTLVSALALCIAGKDDLMKNFESPVSVLEKSMNLVDQIDKVIPVFRNTDGIMIYGRGLSYALALETELKLQETCYLNARAYAASDYRHGPISTTKSFIPSIFFMIDEVTNDDMVALHKRLKEEHHVYSLVVSNKKELAELGDVSIVLPEEAEGFAGLYSLTVFSQMFACMLSLSRGYNPDAPVGVSKRTVTI